MQPDLRRRWGCYQTVLELVMQHSDCGVNSRLFVALGSVEEELLEGSSAECYQFFEVNQTEFGGCTYVQRSSWWLR